MARRIGLLLVAAALAQSLAACAGGSDETNEAIAFTVNRDGFGEIWVMDSDGGNRIQLTESSRSATDASGSGSPAWSPDGTRIAYSSTGDAVAEDPRDGEIYIMRSDGSEKRRLTNDRIADGSPSWSPDGERIAFAHTPGSGSVDAKGVIVVMDTAGAGRVEITDHSGREEIAYDSQPTWSPDGSLIAFTRASFSRSGEPSGGIYIVDQRADVNDSSSTVGDTRRGRQTGAESPSRARRTASGRPVSTSALRAARSTSPMRTARARSA